MDFTRMRFGRFYFRFSLVCVRVIHMRTACFKLPFSDHCHSRHSRQHCIHHFPLARPAQREKRARFEKKAIRRIFFLIHIRAIMHLSSIKRAHIARDNLRVCGGLITLIEATINVTVTPSHSDACRWLPRNMILMKCRVIQRLSRVRILCYGPHAR